MHTEEKARLSGCCRRHCKTEQSFWPTSTTLDSETGAIIAPPDLISLTHLHEPSVVQSLQAPFGQDAIYTFTGPVLLAVNPFTSLRGMYGESVNAKVLRKSRTQTQSRLAANMSTRFADASYRSMMRQLEDEALPNQCILVSGESGAGKTVTTKFVMEYLAALSPEKLSPTSTGAARLSQGESATKAFTTSETFDSTKEQDQQAQAAAFVGNSQGRKQGRTANTTAVLEDQRALAPSERQKARFTSLGLHAEQLVLQLD